MTIDIITVLSEFISTLPTKSIKIKVIDDQLLKRKRAPRDVAVFGGGCFWGVQRLFDDFIEANFEKGALFESSAGFMSPEEEDNIDNDPSYEDLASGALGHVEVVQIHFDPSKVSYEDLCKFFF